MKMSRSEARDRGTAMLLTLSMMMLVTTLAGVGATMAVRDMRGAGEAQQAGSALDAAEAGISQAVAYIRSSGTRKLSCYPTSCTTNPWNPTKPVAADTKGGGHWSAYITPISVGQAADGDGDIYRVHSTGSAGGPAERTIEVDVTVTPIDLPKGIFGRTVNFGGTVDLTQISVFSTGCVYKRSKMNAHYSDGLDAAYGIPIGVHSSQIITDSQGSGQYCPNTNKPIHDGLNVAGLSLKPCNSAFPYDQDRFGGSLTDVPLLGGLAALSPCASAVASYPNIYKTPIDLGLDGQVDVNGSFIRDDRALFRTFGITRPALTDSELEQLKTLAQAQGTYYTSPSGWSVPTNPHTVLFFDLSANQTVDLKPLDGSLWSRGRLTNALDPLCIDASLLIVVTGGNARLNGNTQLAASIYLSGSAPGGQLFKANGTANHIGMLYADTLDITGNFSASLDACYVANPPPSLFDVNPGTYRELDR
jgi:hypothetical protein